MKNTVKKQKSELLQEGLKPSDLWGAGVQLLELAYAFQHCEKLSISVTGKDKSKIMRILKILNADSLPNEGAMVNKNRTLSPLRRYCIKKLYPELIKVFEFSEGEFCLSFSARKNRIKKIIDEVLMLDVEPEMLSTMAITEEFFREIDNGVVLPN